MLVEGLHLYSMVVKVFGSEGSKHFYYYGIGWGKSALKFLFTTLRLQGGYICHNFLFWHFIAFLFLSSYVIASNLTRCPVSTSCHCFTVNVLLLFFEMTLLVKYCLLNVNNYKLIKSICFELHSSVTLSPDLSCTRIDGQMKRIWDIHILSLAAGECIVSPPHVESISGKMIFFLLLPFFWPE